jgi:tol-pal system protein YbgF
VRTECGIDMVDVKRWARGWMASLTLAGCAASSAASPQVESAATVARPPSTMSRLTQASEDQAKRIAELEARLALLETEAREARDARERTPARPAERPPETVRIGPHRREQSAIDAEAPPVQVRLHEAEPEPPEPLVLPPPPNGVNAKLGVVPLPEERAQKLLASPAAAGSVRDQYRTALGFVRERRWNEAERVLNDVLALGPGEELVANATYWRAEVYYAQRRYREALTDFEAVLARAVSGSRAADSLLKVGMCHLRLGDQSTAQRYFRQVVEQYPTSDAARIASREGSS